MSEHRSRPEHPVAHVAHVAHVEGARRIIPATRLAPSSAQAAQDLGLLGNLAGTWRGTGFNLVARPDRSGNAPVFLELNQTDETLQIDPIGSPIPNRGFAQDDIELFGLTYLQKISDSVTGGALHIEPGIWITQPTTTEPPESATEGTQIIARMATIPHGNSMLAGGVARTFNGPPTLSTGASPYAFSIFPSFNSTPILIPSNNQTPEAPTSVAGTIHPAGTSELGSAPGGGFGVYTLTNAASATNPRTPFGNNPAVALPASIDGVGMQAIVNDPIKLLQSVIHKQVAEGHTFRGTVLNIATQASVNFFAADDTTVTPVSVADGAGGIENLPFLAANANTALVYATFWIEEVTPPGGAPTFSQLQYAQMVLLNFPALGILGAGGVPLNFSWPHISVATLKRSFG